MKKIFVSIIAAAAFIALNVNSATAETGYYGCPFDDFYVDCVAEGANRDYIRSRVKQAKAKANRIATFQLAETAVRCAGLYYVMEKVMEYRGADAAVAYSITSKNWMAGLGSELYGKVLSAATVNEGHNGWSYFMLKFNNSFEQLATTVAEINAGDDAKYKDIYVTVEYTCEPLKADSAAEFAKLYDPLQAELIKQIHIF